MGKKEFLEELRACLTGEVPAPIIESNIKYYDTYISEQSNTGDGEMRCIEEIGDPRLIATTIITSYQMSNGNAQYEQERYNEPYQESYENQETQESIHKSIFQMIPLKYKIVGILSIIATLVLLFFIAKALLPVFIIILVFIGIDKLFHR